MHSASHNLVCGVRSTGHEIEFFEGGEMVVWANGNLTHDIVNDELVFMPTESFGTVRELPRENAFVINSYVGAGALSPSGISLLADAGGKKHYFGTRQDCVSIFTTRRIAWWNFFSITKIEKPQYVFANRNIEY
jgi:hypothetical protein